MRGREGGEGEGGKVKEKAGRGRDRKKCSMFLSMMM